MVIKLMIKRVNSLSSLKLEADYLSRFEILAIFDIYARHRYCRHNPIWQRWSQYCWYDKLKRSMNA